MKLPAPPVGAFLQGVVIKENANQSYASSATTMSFIRVIAGEANIPLQDFVVRNDSRCGGTVGAMLSARLGEVTLRSLKNARYIKDSEHGTE